jgi:branched-chain amino acid transport system substrate-binding protein
MARLTAATTAPLRERTGAAMDRRALSSSSLYINLGGNPQKPTFTPKYVAMYFLGAEHVALCFIPMWNRVGAQYGNNHLVAAAFPNDSDGNAFRAVFPPILKSAGYKMELSSRTPTAPRTTHR